jgi:hypothetical protein
MKRVFDYIIEDPIFGRTIHYIGNCTVDKANALVKKHYGLTDAIDKDANGYCCNIQNKVGTIIYFIYTLNGSHGTIVHETNHCVEHISEVIGIQHCDQTREFFAYYQEFLFTTIKRMYEVRSRSPKSRSNL